MAEFDSTTYNEATTYTPQSATIQLTFSDGTTEHTDTVELNPIWAAALIKRIRANAGDHITVHGSLPSTSNEVAAGSPKLDRGLIDQGKYQEWLANKPAA